jgi:peptidoglycan hydrolase-like protein with peptidoglycan-binding domain
MRKTKRSWWSLALLMMGVLSAAMTHAQADADMREWPVLERRDRDSRRSAAVRAAQYLLKEHGFKINVNGEYDKQTAKHVLAFQQQKNLPQDGNKISREMWEKLVVRVRSGSTGDAVRAVQRLLRVAGHDVEVDGNFGPQTESAIKKFQSQENISADGYVGLYTWSHLLNREKV